ncbi:hypothetical protein ACFL3C_04685 [Patescibacteria group bacterium]
MTAELAHCENNESNESTDSLVTKLVDRTLESLGQADAQNSQKEELGLFIEAELHGFDADTARDALLRMRHSLMPDSPNFQQIASAKMMLQLLKREALELREARQTPNELPNLNELKINQGLSRLKELLVMDEEAYNRVYSALEQFTTILIEDYQENDQPILEDVGWETFGEVKLTLEYHMPFLCITFLTRPTEINIEILSEILDRFNEDADLA